MKIVHPSRPARQRRELTPDAARTATVRQVLGMSDAEAVCLHSRWVIVANRGPTSGARREAVSLLDRLSDEAVAALLPDLRERLAREPAEA